MPMFRIILIMVALEKRFLKVSFFLLPFVLYMALMLRMLDNSCQPDSLRKTTNPDGLPREETWKNSYSNMSLHALLQQYELLEKQRHVILEKLNGVLSYSSGGANGLHDIAAVKDAHSSNQGFIEHRSTFDKTITNQHQRNVIKPRYMFNCSNIHQIKLIKKVGHGVSKQAFLGRYRKSTPNGGYKDMAVAVKMVTRHQKDVRLCVEGLKQNSQNSIDHQRFQCFVFPNMKLMKEILLLEQLDSPGLVQLLGYCVRSEETDSTDMSEHGVIAVYEYGERFVLENLQYFPIREKIKLSIKLAEFLIYLENSPLGSLRVKDFKPDHFLKVNSTLKMIDMDDVDNIEPSCDIYSEVELPVAPDTDPRFRSCDNGIQCTMGLCIGDNAIQNLKSMNRLFFKRLLYPISFPSHLTESISETNVRLDTLTITSGELIEFLRSVLEHL